MSDSVESLQGEWTIHHVGELHQTLSALVQQGCRTFDVGGIAELDSAGVQLLIAARNALVLQGHEMSLIHASPCVRDALTCYGLDANLHPVYAEVLA